MQKSIKIPHLGKAGEIPVLMHYDVEQDGDIQVIHCTVSIENQQLPVGLHTRKFDLRSQRINGKYMPLFSDRNISSIEATLFIDEVHATIMKAEQFKLV